MFWLQKPQWGRWLLAGAIVAVAMWVEFRPDPTAEHLFASREIAAGEVIGPDNTKVVLVPARLFETAPQGATATSAIAKGDPVLASATGHPEEAIPTGWWLVEVVLPSGAAIGTQARVVLLDTGSVVEAVVADTVANDPFGSDTGSVAVAPGQASEVAAAATNGRVAVMISSG